MITPHALEQGGSIRCSLCSDYEPMRAVQNRCTGKHILAQGKLKVDSMHRHNEFELREQIRCTGAIDVWGGAGLEGYRG